MSPLRNGPWLAFVGAVLSCSPAKAPERAAAQSAPTAPIASGSTTSATEPPQQPEAWRLLLHDELIARRSDLDRHCQDGQLGHFLPAGDPPLPERAETVESLGCRPAPTAAQLSSKPEQSGETPGVILGLAYCCPPLLAGASPPHSAGLPSCEQATLDFVAGPTSEGRPGVTSGMYGAVLNRGSYFAHCGVPNESGINICTAIRHGRAVGVTVRLTPASAQLGECVAKGVVGLVFPEGETLDVTRTRF